MKWSGVNKKYYVDKGYNFTSLFDDFVVNVRDLNPNSNKEVECQCDYCGCVNSIPYNKYLMQTKTENTTYACKACNHKKMLDLNDGIDPRDLLNKGTIAIDRVISIVESKNGDKLLNPDEYKTCKTKNLKIKCGSCGEMFVTSLASIMNSEGSCKKCGIKKCIESITFSKQYVKDYIESYNNNILLNPDDYVNASTNNLRIKCGLCGDAYVVAFAKYKSGQIMCPQCSCKQRGIKNRLSRHDLVNQVNSVNGNILLNPDDYINNQAKNLRVKCGECGNVYTTSLANYQHGQTRCSVCSHSESDGERTIRVYLDEHQILYEQEKRYDDCRDERPLPFDFYLPQHNLCVEFDGPHHFEPTFGEELFKKTKKHDKIKNQYCNDKNIKLIRIPYWDGNKIEEILNKHIIFNEI